LSGQTQDIVKTAGITSELHRANIGKIIFTSKSVSLSELNESDFLKTYVLTNKSDLFINVFMGNSVTNYMHIIAPELNADELEKSGNFQFTLFIDNHRIYESNLYPGAPYREIKDSSTTLNVPLINNNNEGWYLWSQYFWMRFMNNGGDSVLTEGKHLLKMEIKPYVNAASGVKTGNIIASGTLNLDVKRKPVIDVNTISLNPVKPYNGLVLSSGSFNKNLIKTLIGNINEGVFKNISSIVVLKDGKLLIEEYFNGETRDSLHDPRSVGKSFASTVTGIAINDGYLKMKTRLLKNSILSINTIISH
jgi:hypothetical protein